MKIPQSLTEFKKTQQDVSIFIGENGTGKSTLLNIIARQFCFNSSVKVIGIANSIHDKFEIQSNKFSVLRGRQGRKQAKITIKKAITNISERDIQRLKFASRALEYVGLDPKIGFKVPKIKENVIQMFHDDSYMLPASKYEEEIDTGFTMFEKNKEEIINICEKIKRLERKNIEWLSFDEYNFEALEKFSLTELFVLETKLVKLGIIAPIEVFLSKNDKEISLLSASSGELNLITAIVYISTVIEHNTVILIDEPENSLHPRWQKEYVKNLLDIFYLYEPKIIIATHSPTILNGALLDNEYLDIYRSDNFELSLVREDSKNIEKIYYDIFNIITPENRFVSSLLTDYLNQLAEGIIDMQNFNVLLADIEKSIYDEKQNELIKGVNKIAERIIKAR
ncbi:AAA family ATPase [Desulforhopalus singaporensis]|uniref:AAA domain-containing protein, putative AbiEii toxin, Type IV TA system n=1 Tax=Desulforhopalus singaporensis TaxID=91360 RepID=A0A1H0W3M7_9BACT|nr:ATP-binding protein [Desulforhopalus singaporensis]SDP85340.1 AAA domain-containing protein, putative AbiEii toxin, Type IV TA system [Desulforhopalus singaporensis]